jgi:catechol 2,3-dioxygenase-like lactoylglutathione lyase family enzyme
MDLSLQTIDVVNLFAEDFAGTRTFYQDVLGLPLAFLDENTAVFKLENVMVCLTDVSSGPDLIAPMAVASPGSGSRFVMSVFVDDVDSVCTELAQRGVVLLNGPVNQPWGMRIASFADPAGHIWRIAQDLDVVPANGAVGKGSGSTITP